MSVEVRAVAAPELEAWVSTMHLGFHVQRSAAVDVAYRRDVLDQDLARTLGAFDGGLLAGTLFSFPAELTLPGGTCLVADAISAVTVRPTHRRQGLLTRLIQADLRSAAERDEVASILIAAEYPIYGRFGFGPATDQASYRLQPAKARFRRTSQGRVELLDPAEMLGHAPAVFDRFRRQHPGQIERVSNTWQARLGLRPAPWQASDAPPPRCALYRSPTGGADGYLLYRVDASFERHVPDATLEIVELIALTSDAYLGLWRYVCDVDLVTQVTAGMRCVDEPLGWLLDNPRAALQQTLRTDFLWLRPHDVAATLAARRYFASDRLVLEVRDPLGMSGGRFALEGGPDGASCRPTTATADLDLDLTALGAITLGSTSPRVLHAAGLVDALAPTGLATAERMFYSPVAPWCSTFF